MRLIMLREAPTQKRLITGRLSLEASVVQRLIRTPLQNNVSPAQIIRRLENLDNRTDTRILLINGQSGEVLGDTGSTLTGRNLFDADRPLRFVLGRDTRESGDWIERELAFGIASQGGSLTGATVTTTDTIDIRYLDFNPKPNVNSSRC